MNNNRKLLMVMLTGVLVLLAACGDSSEGSNAKSNNKSADNSNSSTQNTNGDSANKDSKGIDENKTENASEGTDNTQTDGQEDTAESTSANSNDGESVDSGDSGVTENIKDKYLTKLNEMEESDRNAESKTTTVAMEEQEAERYKNWDKKLNEIYGVLQEQLSKEEMDKLREEQRDWVKHRDEAAKEASLEYKGGTTESLEYVATQASLTKERCYALVANYMN